MGDISQRNRFNSLLSLMEFLQIHTHMHTHRRYQIRNKTVAEPSHNVTIKTIDKRTALAAGLRSTVKHSEMRFLFENPS